MRWMSRRALACVCGVGGLLGGVPGCALVPQPSQPSQSPEPSAAVVEAAPTERQVLCRLAVPRPPDAELTQALSQAAGLPVRSVRAIDEHWLQVTLVCTGAESCQAGVNRLAAARALVSEVVPDARRQRPRAPRSAEERP